MIRITERTRVRRNKRLLVANRLVHKWKLRDERAGKEKKS